MNADEWTTAGQCETAQCVEVAWRKSSLSGNNGQCVEVALPRPRLDKEEGRER